MSLSVYDHTLTRPTAFVSDIDINPEIPLVEVLHMLYMGT